MWDTDIQDVHPLSAVQQGMLVHSAATRGQDPYVVQMTCRLDGHFQPELFGAAWQLAAARHPVLRSSVHWRGLRTPVQVVHRSVNVPLRLIKDPFDAGSAAWNDVCEADLAEGFNLASAPLLRVTVMAEGEQAHRLLWTHHHLILDGWSIGVLLREVLQYYQQLVAGAQPIITGAPSYADHCRKARAQDPAMTAYWRTLLSDYRSSVAPPDTVARLTAVDADTQVGGDAVRRNLGPLMDRVEDWARRRRTTVGAVHHLAWAMTLSAYAHAKDLVIGSTVSLRPAYASDVDTALGPMINTVPVRLDLRHSRTLREILNDVFEQLVLQTDMHHLALADIKAVSEVPASQPLFETSIAFENYPVDRDVDGLLNGVRLGNLQWRNSLNAALSLVVVPAERLVSLSFDSARFDDWTVGRMVDLYTTILARLVDAEPEETVGGLMRNAVRGASGESGERAAEFVPLPVSFADHVARAPEAPAVRDGDTVVTYGQLSQRVARLSDALRARGVGPGDRVSLVIEPSTDLLTGMLAVLSVGAAYVPVNPADPRARQQEVLRLARSALTLLAVPDPSLTHDAGPTLLTGTVSHDTAAPTVAADACGGHIDGLDPAYVMFTSGSTGRPKGVIVPHLALSNYLSWAARTYDLGPGTITPAHTSPSFDMSVTALLGPLSAGGQVTFVGRGRGVEGLLAHLESPSGTGTVKLTPAHLVAFRTRQPRGRLDTVVVGGEELRGPLVGEWLAKNPRVRFYNEYGPTEATVGCVVHQVVAGDVLDGAGPVPIGHAIPGTGFQVLDEHLDECAAGAVGELFLTGACLANGYLESPRLTAKSFLPLSGPEGGGRRMYRTGDLVRMGSQGLVYLGRRDDQVKLRGFRVELGEIDTKLMSLPQVAAAAVVLNAEEGLKAFVVAADGHHIVAADLAMELEQLLPSHMVPARYSTIDELPLSASGKVDRQRLRVQRADLAVDVKARTEPTTPIEQTLVDTWRRVLRLNNVGVNDDFFRLGGDSLAAMSVLAQVPASIQGRFSAADVLVCRTPRALARRIDAQPPRPEGRNGLRVADSAHGSGVLSPTQLRFFVLHNLDTSAYNCASAVLVTGDLDLASLQGAIDLAIARHAILRTSFVLAHGRPIATVHPSGAVRAEYIDLRDNAEWTRSDEAKSLIASLAGQPFDLAKPPLVRVAVISLSDDVHVLALVLHHIVSDAQSQSVLVRELFEDYASIRQGASNVRADTAQYADVVRWPTESEQQQSIALWRSNLESPLPELLVTDAARPPAGTPTTAGQIRLPINEPDWTALNALSRQLGVSVFSALSATLRILLTRFTGTSGEVAIGTPVSLRDDAALTDVIGPLINTVVLRNSIDLTLPIADLLVVEQDTVAVALSRKDLPFERLARDLAPSNGSSRTPLFDVLLDFQRVKSALPPQAGLTLDDFDYGPPPARFDVQVDIWEALGEVTVRFTYRADLFDEESVQSLAEGYVALLAGLVADPFAPAAQLPLKPRQNTVPIEGPARDWGAFEPLDDSFRRRAAEEPDAIAVRAGNDEMTYRDLDRAVDTMAARLQEHGVGPEKLVGVAVDRSIAQLIAVLGVLRSGGVYFPLDPQMPDDRLAFMVADAGPLLLLADAGNRPRAEGFGLPVMDIEQRQTDATYRPLRPALGPANAAYAIYTSGSTGQPKGVVVSHEALVNRIWWAQETFVLDSEDRVLHKTPVGFDVSVWELLWPQTVGATTIMADPKGHQDIDYLEQVLIRERVTVVHFVPSLLRVVVDSGTLGRCPSLRFVICSGEVLPPALNSDAQASTTAQIWNLYGPTEAAIDVTGWTGSGDRGRPRVPIGTPVANTSILALDDGLQVQPENAVGELCIAGVQVARSYIGQPRLTADRFRPDPTGRNPGGRLYRTGDLGRIRADGMVEYLGRKDDQIKVRGYRVELGEIESVLSSHPAVAHCAVRVVDGPGGVALQAAYVAPDVVSSDDLAQFCARLLPSAMVPTFWSSVTSIPRGASGKVDRSALPEPHPVRPRSNEPPSPGAETRMAAVWRDILASDLDIGRADSFFSLGGDSILALRLISRAREDGLELTLPDVFDAPTLSGMAARAAGSSSRSAARVYQPFTLLSNEQRKRLPASAVDGYPLTVLQSGMVFHALYEPDTHLYKNFDSVRIKEDFVSGAFVTAVETLIARHPVLRTSFDLSPREGLFQVVHDTVPADVSVIDLRQLDADSADRAFAAWRDTQLRVVWDFGAAPLIGFHVHLFGDDTFRVSLPHHHAILDGWSLTMLASELLATYRRVVDGEPPEAELSIGDGFGRYVAEERAAVQDESALAFWDSVLAVSNASTLLTPGSSGAGPATVRVTFTDQETIDIRAWGSERGLPLKSVLFAVHCAVLSAASGQGRFLTGMVVNGRAEDDEGLGALGLFLNSIPVPVDPAGQTWESLVGLVFESERAALPYRHVPVEVLRRRSGRGTPLFDTLFNFTHFRVLDAPLTAGQAAVPRGPSLVGHESHTNASIPLVANFDLSPDGQQLAVELAGDGVDSGGHDFAALATLYHAGVRRLLQARPDEFAVSSPVDGIVT